MYNRLKYPQSESTSQLYTLIHKYKIFHFVLKTSISCLYNLDMGDRSKINKYSNILLSQEGELIVRLKEKKMNHFRVIYDGTFPPPKMYSNACVA